MNDTSSVVAAASIFGTAALGFAVVVKLVRTLMIIPISVGLSVIEARKNSTRSPLTLRGAFRLVPWFLIGFIVVALVNSAGLIPDHLRDALVTVSGFLIAMALAGIGLSTDLPALRRSGLRPLALGGLLSAIVTTVTLLLMWATGALAPGTI